MSTTHPCPTCGWTLRWVAEQSAWACDRCGTIIPAGQPQPAVAQASGLAPAGQRPVATSGGAFGGSAASSSPARSPSQPPGDVFGRSPSQPPGVYQAPNAGFGGSATAAGGHGPSQFGAGQFGGSAGASQFGPGAYAPPQGGGFGGSATAAQPRAQSQSGAPPMMQQPAPMPQMQPAPMPQLQPAPMQQQVPQQPAQQPGYGPGGYPSYTPPPASSVEQAPIAGSSRRGLLIGGLAAVAIITGIVIAVVIGKGGGSKPGLASADEVTTQTIAALTAGDVDRLVALMATEHNQSTLECEEGAVKLDLPKALADQREMLTKVVGKSKGLTVEVVKLGMPKTIKLEKGKEIGKGCKLTREIAMHEHDLNVKVKFGDKPARDRTYKIMLHEAEGRWLLASPPAIQRPGDCATASKAMIGASKADLETKKLGASALARLEKAATQHCTEDGWPDEVIVCFEDATGSSKPCTKQLTVDQAEKLDKHLAAIIAEDVKSREVPTVADTPTPPTVDPTVDPTKPAVDPTADPTIDPTPAAGSGSAVDEDLQLPPICEDYKAEIEKLGGCRRIKADIRAAQRKRYDTMIEGWNRVVKKTPQMVTSMETICKTGVTTLVDLRKTSCR